MTYQWGKPQLDDVENGEGGRHSRSLTKESVEESIETHLPIGNIDRDHQSGIEVRVWDISKA